MEKAVQAEFLTDELFQNPTAKYRGIPFWSWNCKVTKELIDWQLDCFKAMGFGGVDIHPRTGLDTEYLGKEYLRLTKYAAEKCKEKGLICWLYDDDRFPSGAAGGIVTKERWARGRYLWITEKHGDVDDAGRCGMVFHGKETEKAAPCGAVANGSGMHKARPCENGSGMHEARPCENGSRETMNRAEKWGKYVLPGYCLTKEEMERPDSTAAGYLAGAFSLCLEDGFLADYRWLGDDGAVEEALAAGERVRFVYVKLFDEEQWFEGQTYVDTMNPAAVRAFLDSTHEKYYGLLGEEFGKSVPAIFTDEPRMAPRKKRTVKLTCAESGEDIIIPYTEYFGEQMRRKYGGDVMDKLPEYIWELPHGEKSVFRYQYQDMLSECFTHAFMDQICEWCQNHGIAMTGHVLGEDSLLAQAWILGDCMRCYRKMDLPGVDILVDYRQFMTVKQAASVAKQNGKEGVVSELYGVTGWDCDFKTYKLQGDWQAALGITVRVPHLSWMSMEGEAKRDWPASIFYQSPWYREFPYIEDYFSRLNTVLTRGKACTRVAVMHPVESAWMLMGPNEQTGEELLDLDKQLDELVNRLLFGCIDFDFVAESLLAKQSAKAAGQTDELSAHGSRGAGSPKFRVGCMAYDVVVVPGMKTIRSTTLDALEFFAKQGGTVLFMGEIPAYMDGVKSDKPKELAGKCVVISGTKSALMESLEKYRDIEIRKMDGSRSENLFYQMRHDLSCDWLFLCHVYPWKNRISGEECYRIRIKGEYRLIQYDAQTGEIGQQEIVGKVIHKEGITEFVWNCYAQDSLLLCLKENTVKEGEDVAGKPERVKLLAAEECQKPFLSQIACAAVGGIPGNMPEYERKRKKVYQTVACLQKADSYERQEYNMLLLDYAEYQVDEGSVYSREEILRVDNHIRSMLGFTSHGDEAEQPWALETKEEHKVRLFYSFVSEIETEAFLGIERPELCRIWLNGRETETVSNGYYVDTAIRVVSLPMVQAGENRLTVEMRYDQKGNLENLYVLGDFDVELQASGAVIRKRRQSLTVGDITRQGMPFYTGNLEYHFEFSVEESGRYMVQVRHFDGPLLGVSLDGEDLGRIAYAPHRLSLGRLESGGHHLVIRLYGNRFNGFGHLHNANDEFEWIGPAAYRTKDDEWTDCYMVRPNGILSPVEIQKER